MAPHLRVVLPSSSLWQQQAGGAPVDLEGELRRAAVRAVGDALSEDTLEALACVACEALEGAVGDSGAKRLPGALGPVLSDAGVQDELRAVVLDALLAVAVAEAEGSAAAGACGSIGGRKAANTAPQDDEPTVEGQKRWKRRGDVEAARAAVYLREQAARLTQEEREEDAHLERVAQTFAIPTDPDDNSACVADTSAARVLTARAPAKEENDTSGSEDEVTIRDREATKSRLRQLGDVATYFGESDAARSARLTRLELSRDQDELAGGSTNVMQIIDRRKERQMPAILASHTALAVSSAYNDKAPFTLDSCASAEVEVAGDADETFAADSGEEGADPAEEAADERTREVIVWLRSTLRDWESSLRSRGAAEGTNGAKGGASHLRAERAQYRQSKQYLKPLRRKLKEGEISPSIVNILAEIADNCNKQHYKEAHEAYMRLAIGNSAWPMGCTFVTFHDRPNRHLIGEGAVAHVLDDETTRKYVQMVKRLVSFCETSCGCGNFKL